MIHLCNKFKFENFIFKLKKMCFSIPNSFSLSAETKSELTSLNSVSSGIIFEMLSTWIELVVVVSFWVVSSVFVDCFVRQASLWVL